MSSLKSRKRTERITNALCFIALIFLTCLCMLPIWWIFRSSLMSNAELFKWPPAFFPPRWLFSNYANTLEYFKFWTYLKNTMIIIVPSVIFGTITATMCGYAFARLRFRLRNFLFTLCVGSMLLPTMVTLIPLYIMWTKFFNMSNTFWPLILPYLCGGGAFNIFLIRQFVRSIPRELDEAATIDGAGYFRILLNVIVPSIKSAMIVVAMFLFIQIWNDLLQQMIYINTDDKFTIYGPEPAQGLPEDGLVRHHVRHLHVLRARRRVLSPRSAVLRRRHRDDRYEKLMQRGMRREGRGLPRAPARVRVGFFLSVLEPCMEAHPSEPAVSGLLHPGRDDAGCAVRHGPRSHCARARGQCAFVGGVPGRI